jgi:hypothetical protein
MPLTFQGEPQSHNALHHEGALTGRWLLILCLLLSIDHRFQFGPDDK